MYISNKYIRKCTNNSQTKGYQLRYNIIKI